MLLVCDSILENTNNKRKSEDHDQTKRVKVRGGKGGDTDNLFIRGKFNEFQFNSILKSNQNWFLERGGGRGGGGENWSAQKKPSRCRVQNQQTQPTYDAESGNRTRDTIVEGERSHHYANPGFAFVSSNRICFHIEKVGARCTLLCLTIFHHILQHSFQFFNSPFVVIIYSSVHVVPVFAMCSGSVGVKLCRAWDASSRTFLTRNNTTKISKPTKGPEQHENRKTNIGTSRK